MTIAQQLALWADKLRDMSSLGLRFANDMYDKERYHEIQEMAMAMHARATDSPLEELEPLRDSIYMRPTPLCVGDAAIIDEDGRLLLIQRADNQKWAMPGGALAVGESAAEGVVREALEETGVYCEAVRLAGVFDSRLHKGLGRYHLYQFVFLCRPLPKEPVVPPSHAHEVLGQAWYREDELPANLDVSHAGRIPILFQVWRNERPAYFDS